MNSKIQLRKADIHSAGILLFTEDKRHFLLMKHVGRWDLPKGHLEMKETKLEGAVREFEEETGISREKIRIDDNFIFRTQYMAKKLSYGDIKLLKELTIYIAYIPARVKVFPTEHPGYEWMEWNPPHKIQQQTIDPLLEEVWEYFKKNGKS
jgi:bis(5'-nucleosidyl)-tetraphosphatase